jgi:hypothetical protein
MAKFDIEHQGRVDVYKVTRKENPLGKVLGGIAAVLLLMGIIGSCSEKHTAAEPRTAIHGQVAKVAR